jgi:hypothetical protein
LGWGCVEPSAAVVDGANAKGNGQREVIGKSLADEEAKLLNGFSRQAQKPKLV